MHKNPEQEARDEDTLRELAKYKLAFSEEGYRDKSGMHMWENEAELKDLIEGEEVKTATDYGCGNGRGAQLLLDLGCRNVALVDFVGYDIVDPGIKKLVQAGKVAYYEFSLWDPHLRGLPVSDLGTCTDVMEHIPENRVDEVLQNIALTSKIALFRIAQSEDSEAYRKKFNGGLHVTIRPMDWWLKRIKVFWGEVDSWVARHPTKPHKDDLVFICKKNLAIQR